MGLQFYVPPSKTNSQFYVEGGYHFDISVYCVKSVRTRSYSGQYFPSFGLNTERYRVSLRIQSKCGKILTRITKNKDTLYAVITVIPSLNGSQCQQLKVNKSTPRKISKYQMQASSCQLDSCNMNMIESLFLKKIFMKSFMKNLWVSQTSSRNQALLITFE